MAKIGMAVEGASPAGNALFGGGSLADQVAGESEDERKRRIAALQAAQLRTSRVLGGGSSINGQLANRGAPSDYDEWQSLGAEGWGWQAVLPYFKKVERDMDFDGPWHGKEGRIPVRRIFPNMWNGHAAAAAEAFKA